MRWFQLSTPWDPLLLSHSRREPFAMYSYTSIFISWSAFPLLFLTAKTSLLKVPLYPWSFILLLDPKSLVAFFISENLYALRARSSFAISRIRSCGEGTFAFHPLLCGTCALLLRDRNKMARRSNTSREKAPAVMPTIKRTLFDRLLRTTGGGRGGDLYLRLLA